MSAIDLGRLADALIDQIDEPAVGASLIRLVRRDDVSDDVELGIRPLDGHPAAALDGFEAPADWIVIGLLSGGWAAPMDGIRPSSHPDAMRVTQVVLVDRDGAIESRVRFPDGSIMREGPGSGAVLDALCAALGLPRVA